LLYLHHAGTVAGNLGKEIGEQVAHFYFGTVHSGIADVFGLGARFGEGLEAAQSAVQDGNRRAGIIHGRGQRPGGNLGKHHQAKSGVLVKAAVMLDQYGILKRLRIQCACLFAGKIEQRPGRIDKLSRVYREIHHQPVFFGRFVQ